MGIEIKRDRKIRTLGLSQENYLRKLIHRFGMAKSKAVSTPFAQHFKLLASQSPLNEDNKAEMRNVPYSSATGSLIYNMVCTRLDLAHVMSVVSRFMANLGKAHWGMVKWVFKYLRGSLGTGLVYGGAGKEIEAKILGYSDADYAADMDRR